MPKLNYTEKVNKAPYKDTKNIGEEFCIKTETRGINFNIYYLAQYTQNIILTCAHLKLSEHVRLLPVQCFHDPVWICTCASQFGLATVKCPLAIQEKPDSWKQNTQTIVWDWVLKFKFILKYFSKTETLRYIRISVILLIWKSSTRYQREICKDQDRSIIT